MARRISEPKDPYDPVAQKFLADLASRPVATTAPEATPTPIAPPPPAAPLKARSREKRVLLDADEDALTEGQVARLAAELRTPLKLSHVLRALLLLLRRAEPHALAAARQAGPIARPPNGDAAALARFEEQVADLLAAAIRNTPPRP